MGGHKICDFFFGKRPAFLVTCRRVGLGRCALFGKLLQLARTSQDIGEFAVAAPRVLILLFRPFNRDTKRDQASLISKGEKADVRRSGGHINCIEHADGDGPQICCGCQRIPRFCAWFFDVVLVPIRAGVVLSTIGEFLDMVELSLPQEVRHQPVPASGHSRQNTGVGTRIQSARVYRECQIQELQLLPSGDVFGADGQFLQQPLGRERVPKHRW